MYDDLISSLRICRRINSANDNCIAFHDGSCEAEPVCMYELMDKAAAAIEELSKPRWISVEERLPEVKQEVLCACRAGIFEVLKYVNGSNGPWYKDSRHVYMSGFVTHWMPLPEPPKEE